MEIDSHGHARGPYRYGSTDLRFAREARMAHSPTGKPVVLCFGPTRFRSSENSCAYTA